MKKTLLASIIAVATLSLTACSTIGFDDIKLKSPPVWDTSNAAVSAWGNEDFLTEDRDQVQSTYIKLYNENKSCYIDGRIAYDTSSLEVKDELNSQKYLNDLGLQNVSKEKFSISTTTINDVKYSLGKYTLPESFGKYSYHETAVRVFSSSIPIGQITENATGLPLVIIDLACKNKEDINSTNWDKATSFFKLVLDEYREVVNNTLEPTAPTSNENADIPFVKSTNKPPVFSDGNNQ